MGVGVIFRDIIRNHKKTCPKILGAYNFRMLCRPLSVHEANVLIPLIQDELEHLQFVLSKETESDVEDTSEGLPGDLTLEGEILLTSDDVEEATVRRDIAELIQAKVLQLQRYGAFVRQINPGIVDFYSIRAGQPVRLTWHFGEEEVSHWQPFDETGFYGHYPISDQDVFGRKVLN